MAQEKNKVIKRRRRAAYLKRKKELAKQGVVRKLGKGLSQKKESAAKKAAKHSAKTPAAKYKTFSKHAPQDTELNEPTVPVSPPAGETQPDQSETKVPEENVFAQKNTYGAGVSEELAKLFAGMRAMGVAVASGHEHRDTAALRAEYEALEAQIPELISKKVLQTATPEELNTLEEIRNQLRKLRDEIAPLPFDKIRSIRESIHQTRKPDSA